MARNYVQEGDVLDYNAGAAAVVSGSVVVMAKRIGVALGDIPAHETGSVSVTGVWIVPKLSTDVVAMGDLLYWDADDFRMTTTAGGNVQAGYAAAAAGAGAAAVRIKINS